MLPDFILLYVDDTGRSARFYSELLDRPPINSSEGFAMFEARPGLMLGLWKKDEGAPSANPPGGFELGIPVAADSDVDRIASDWAARGIPIAQQPEDMDFGRTFTALDPDGHRLRIYRPALRQ